MKNATSTKGKQAQPDILKRAAYWMVDSAQLDFNSGTVCGQWVLNDAECVQMRKDHDEKKMLAKRLRAMARILSGHK